MRKLLLHPAAKPVVFVLWGKAAQEKRALATENLALLHRARLAEERLAARERENAQLRRSAARVVRI